MSLFLWTGILSKIILKKKLVFKMWQKMLIPMPMQTWSSFRNFLSRIQLLSPKSQVKLTLLFSSVSIFNALSDVGILVFNLIWIVLLSLDTSCTTLHNMYEYVSCGNAAAGSIRMRNNKQLPSLNTTYRVPFRKRYEGSTMSKYRNGTLLEFDFSKFRASWQKSTKDFLLTYSRTAISCLIL